MEKYIFLLLLSISLQITYYSVDEFFGTIKNDTYNLTEVNYIKNNLAEFFDESYVFAGIAKNPPQPSFNSSFFKEVDIYQKLKDYNITGNNISIYEFYHDISSIIHELNDLHVSVIFKYFYNYSFILPLYLNIKMENDTPVVYAKLVNSIYHEMFDQTLIKKIENNLNNRVKSINGRSPLEYIEEYCENFYHVKSPHGCFSINYFANGGGYLVSCPMSKEKLKNFNLIYENNDNITTEYKIYDINTVKKSNNTMKSNINGKNKLNDYLFKKNISHSEIKSTNDVNQNNEKKNNIFASTIKGENKEITWDYNYSNELLCKIDKENQINFIVSRTYAPEKLTPFFDVLEKCFKSIYENEFPIIYMTEQNGGGYGSIYYLISALLSPIYHPFNEYMAFRKNLIKYIIGEESIRNKETFETIDEEYLNNTSNEYFTNTFIEANDYHYIIKSIKKNINLSKNRKPHKIILFTEGLSYSAASCVIKGMQSKGSAITVGYIGNPLKVNETFESSNSPTAIFEGKIFEQISQNYNNLLNKSVEIVQVSGIPLFENRNSNIPMEYQVFPVDEYFKFYEELNPDTYLTYVNEANRIMKKYETECNKDNKKLLFITDECKKIGNSYTHGGYECGDDGKWTKKCVASYCDEGYIFDPVDQKCNKDIFYTYDILYELGVIIFIVSLVISVLIIAGLIVYIYINKVVAIKLEEGLLNESDKLVEDQVNK